MCSRLVRNSKPGGLQPILGEGGLPLKDYNTSARTEARKGSHNQPREDFLLRERWSEQKAVVLKGCSMSYRARLTEQEVACYFLRICTIYFALSFVMMTRKIQQEEAIF